MKIRDDEVLSVLTYARMLCDEAMIHYLTAEKTDDEEQIMIGDFKAKVAQAINLIMKQ
mgnify:FL=1